MRRRTEQDSGRRDPSTERNLGRRFGQLTVFKLVLENATITTEEGQAGPLRTGNVQYYESAER